MSSESSSDTGLSLRNAPWWHLLLVLGVSLWFESLFLQHRLNMTDEGWTLYAAMRLHAGGVLYSDILFPFPPGHLLSAWIAYALDPPGVVLARYFYAGFNVVLCLGIYLLGRRVMPSSFALLAGLLVAVAAPRSHMAQLLFGYRYLIFTVLALLAFSRRLRSEDWRWMIAAGAWAGVALCFRLTPAFAVSVAIGLGVLVAHREVRLWLRDWSAFALGLLLVAGPVVGWLVGQVGFETLWREAVVRPVVMTDLQSLPVPQLVWPPFWERGLITKSFIAVEFRLWPGMLLAYSAVLLLLWGRSLVARTRFPHALLFAVAVWGAIYSIRSFGRADEPHLDSAIPPACLVFAHLLSVTMGRLGSALSTSPWPRRVATAGTLAVVLLAWMFLLRTDHFFDPDALGSTPVKALDGRIFLEEKEARILESRLDRLLEATRPGDIILDLSGRPLYNVLTDRLGPGQADVMVPGTLMSDEEESRFLERLERFPPAAVIWPESDFDRMEKRAVRTTAPRITRWVKQHYERAGFGSYEILMFPKGSPYSMSGRKLAPERGAE